MKLNKHGVCVCLIAPCLVNFIMADMEEVWICISAVIASLCFLLQLKNKNFDFRPLSQIFPFKNWDMHLWSNTSNLFHIVQGLKLVLVECQL